MFLMLLILFRSIPFRSADKIESRPDWNGAGELLSSLLLVNAALYFLPKGLPPSISAGSL